MPKRLFLALILLVAAPLVLLGILSNTTYRDRHRLAREQIRGLYQSRLIAFENEVDRVISSYEHQLQGLFDSSVIQVHPQSMMQGATMQRAMQSMSGMTMRGTEPMNPYSISLESLRRIDSRTPVIRTSLLVDRRGHLIYPPAPLTSSSEEATFYQSIVKLASNRPATSVEAPDSKVMKKRRSVAMSPRLPMTAWQVWYMDEGMQLVHWQQVPGTNYSLGTLLERSRWIADLTAALPDSSPAERHVPSIPNENAVAIKSIRSSYKTSSKSEALKSTLSTGYTALVNQRGEVVYQWGSTVVNIGNPLASRSLPAPLSDWTFEAFDINPVADVSPLPTLLSLAGLAVLVASLGGYVLTSVRRQTREAQSRVSFASQVSHELRTPLTNIRLYAELAESDLESMPKDSTTESLRKRLDVIETESQRLGRLVSGVLEVIRDRHATQSLRLTATSPEELIDLVIGQFGPRFEMLEMEIERVSQANTPLMMDRDLVEMILINLLSNVEKYASDGKWVGVESSIVEQQLVVRVGDAGPGIPKRYRKTVFAPFKRLDDSISAPSGTGIGLTIARRMAHRHGGSLTLVDSPFLKHPHGACFELRIPLSR